MAVRAARATEEDVAGQLTDESEALAPAARLHAPCVGRGATVSVAESCTGGLVGHLLTEVAGSSDYFLGGIVSYADDVKLGLLDVPPEALERHGAVSAQTAVAMAVGCRRRFGSTLAVSVTGIAGPSGGTTEKPVGLTYVAVSDADGQDVRRYVWEGDRSANKWASAAAAIRLLLERLGEGSGS